MFASDFLRPARVVALTVAAVAVVAVGGLSAAGLRVTCDGPCPVAPVAEDGSVVGDRFWFLHQELGTGGTITARMTSMTGTITYPPPDHDEIVPGLVPWAKSGVIVKDGTRQGSRYAALAMTGRHGVHFQHGYRHDDAGRPGGVSADSPRWLRLTRSGDTVTGAESADGVQWHTVGTARLAGLPDTVRVGLFATSPCDLTLRETALGGNTQACRFTQAVGVFDSVTVEGGDGEWVSEPVGQMNQTDWEKLSNPSGVVQNGSVIRISGTGDISPAREEFAWTTDQSLAGFLAALVIVLVVAARYGASTGMHRRRVTTVGAAAFAVGLVAAGAVVPIGAAIARSKNMPVQALTLPTGLRVVVGLAVALALSAMLAYGLGALTRRRWAGSSLAVALVAVPFAVSVIPLLPDTVAEWLLRVTPAAAFAVKQTAVEYPQITSYYSPSTGYFPLPWWAGLTVLAAYTAVILWLASRRRSAHPARVAEQSSTGVLL
ncbi:hypothetical protein Ait01nite_088850 [Actinoplanes italicus]|uniref:DUF1349 domain-containing protein n=1 Tax=Actinoplanes italicus TaxID=113567 RepID=A0A2T0JWQ5_9ACTN|nr:hypothetical protein [Actinoplanes italicus]PRX12204.1 hypothetical protein CLV67_12961 [Actinoplanes italicus]GIE35840.1 hypothetical protein Ait01nite_088850 [Actinoplanes italicus]